MEKQKTEMGSIILDNGTTFISDHVPGPNETASTAYGYPQLIEKSCKVVVNTGNGGLYDCIDIAENGDQTWQKMADITPDNVYTPGPAYTFVTLAFNESRTVTTTKQVVVVIQATGSGQTMSNVKFEVDTGSGFSLIAQTFFSACDTLTVMVPAGATYRLVSESGTNQILSVREL